ncbi:chemotaxis protein [bacterium]|nr:chemotaxis protein [bacterium]
MPHARKAGRQERVAPISTHKSRNKLWVAGIGASAGGVQACLKLLSQLPRQGRLACILANHQRMDGQTELLARQLARQSLMEVCIARSSEALQADKVYLVPSGKDCTVEGQRIVLKEPARDSPSTPSVSRLFCSIAAEFGRHAIGIILSGAGSDGVSGCRAIQAHGGLTLAQDPACARFNGMPGAAIRAGLVHHVLSPEQIARQVADTICPPVQGGGLPEILDTVHRTTGIDFKGYKPETLLRRIHTRMLAIKSPSLELYASRLAHDPAEVKTLQTHFLVSLSNFFRDRESFYALQDCLKESLAGKSPGEAVRIWTPGCASGEETYTLALLMCEILGPKISQIGVWIQGTDLNREALASAIQGSYAAASVKEVDPPWLDRYFERTGQKYRVREPLRSMCRFSFQDVLTDVAPTNLDLISCRNLLIYLNSEVQGQLMRKFHQALGPQGLLFIGPAERVGLVGHSLFRPVDACHRIYRRRAA